MVGMMPDNASKVGSFLVKVVLIFFETVLFDFVAIHLMAEVREHMQQNATRNDSNENSILAPSTTHCALNQPGAVR
jgi:hypothetical protein